MHVKDEILARMYVLLTLLSVVPLLVAVQVVRVTVFQGAELREQGERQATSQFTIPAMRGTIVDRHGRTLAVNTARYDIAVDPTIPGYAERAPAFFGRLARTTGRSPAWYRSLVSRSSSRQYARLERGIDESALDALREIDLPGLIVQSRFSRRYTYGTAAAHLLGHVDTDLHGIAGIESRYEPVLAGVDGRQSAQRDRRGVARASANGMTVEPMHGETVVLTIDLVRQAVLEEELARGVAATGAKWGTAIAMDPWTGAVLAMANVPTYDANNPGAYSHPEMRNHAVTDQLEPGSTFKLVTAVAAIEEDAASLDDSVETGDGWIVLHGRTLRDTHALGTVTFRDVIAHSSNVGIALVAEKLKASDFHRHARSLGFGRKTGIDLPGEVAGVLKDPKDWSGTTLTSMSRGYEVAASPLQVLVAYAALANGGTLVRPFVVAERRDVTGNVVWTASQDSLRRAFRKSTARTLIPAFEQVVTDGSAREAAVPGVRIAGKTGTARKVRDGSYESGAYRASFVGFYPVEDPRVVLIVVLDEPRTSYYGGSAAAPVFRETVRRWLATTDDAPLGTLAEAPDPDDIEIPSPDVVRLPLALAADRVRAYGLRTSVSDDGPRLTVASQRPEPGAALRQGSRVRLAAESGDETGSMPDLRGLTVREAVWWLTALGITPRVEGSGTVRSQSPNPGSALGQTAVLRCR
jgi:cell division protein FtsI (penicillin-binding protein 3)